MHSLTGALVAWPSADALASAKWNPAFTMFTQSGNESAAYTSSWGHGAQIEVNFDGGGAIDETCPQTIDQGALVETAADTHDDVCFTTGGGIVFATLVDR